MKRIPTAALILAILGVPSFAGQGDEKAKKPDRTIEILREDGKVVFREKGKPKEKGKPRAVGVVVGETVRWVNRDTEPHRLKSVAKVDGEPLFATQAIQPGAHKDVVFNIKMYRGLGGRPAQYVTIKYRGDEHADHEGELTFMSAGAAEPRDFQRIAPILVGRPGGREGANRDAALSPLTARRAYDSAYWTVGRRRLGRCAEPGFPNRTEPNRKGRNLPCDRHSVSSSSSP